MAQGIELSYISEEQRDVVALLEIGIFANATVPWLEGKEANKPRIRVVTIHSQINK